ncbi:MAG: radical SAM protein [Bacteroidales bacterium]|nr:radical SAM protein [Bacteroidales bacterium]
MMDACIIVTWRCPFRCKMCSIWQHPSLCSEEFAPSVLEKLPRMNAVNITGGEPFEREDLEDIVHILVPKSRRIVFSTNGWYTERIVSMARRYPEAGFRISLEGLQAANDALRGVPGGFERGMETVRRLQELGCQDVGVAITLSGTNHRDLLPLYRLVRGKGLEFATAAAHNSFYFHKQDNAISDVAGVAAALDELVGCMLAENSPKSWARAYFNNGLKGYVLGHPRPLPCRAGSSNFFVDPYANVLPCNGMEEAIVMGNLAEAATFEEIWESPRAREVRSAVAICQRQCWMMGTASPAIKSHPFQVGGWIIEAKCRRCLRHDAKREGAE